ncbi:ROK family protein [Sediminivirga luteola]|uniref:Glucokinase n=1 Tax=Sediminivirga luteola TaxID=1774748 RepID=A0A8J2XLX0_9MICO|nr:ROK family protein [Sediminivirga luteola]MCI2264887.1 ROK family protein [Sediminivirga luteola]GGA26536.1 hypothetical protein GCM10011333_31780 [Sediminivirga luteola]
MTARPAPADPAHHDAPVLAVDVGGTKVEAALVDAAGQVLPGTRVRVPTGPASAASANAFSQALAEAVAAVRGHALAAGVRQIGVGAAGPVDLMAGTISPLNLPAVREFDIVGALRGMSGLEDVRLRLDGTCIALAELWKGAAQGVSNAIVFVVSTGIGGGVVADGRVVTGASGNAGHLGQLIVDRVSGDDVAAATAEGQASGRNAVEWARRQGWPGTSGEELARDYARGKTLAVRAVERSASALGRGLANVAVLLDTELAIMGGGFSFVTEDYPAMVERAAHAHSVNAYARKLRVTRAALGGDAPLVGAAAQVLREDLLG